MIEVLLCYSASPKTHFWVKFAQCTKLQGTGLVEYRLWHHQLLQQQQHTRPDGQQQSEDPVEGGLASIAHGRGEVRADLVTLK